jgi:catechol 2,3-dioxygenase-like lactoylglutathione lyase family enzyme
MNPQPLIAVADVEATSAWYQAVLGLDSGHGDDEYERLLCDGRMVMQVHRWDVHQHPFLGDPKRQPYGNGVLLWFQTDHFDKTIKRIKKHKAEVLEGPLVNRDANHREVWLRDPNGYVIVIAGAYGDLDSAFAK